MLLIVSLQLARTRARDRRGDDTATGALGPRNIYCHNSYDYKDPFPLVS